MGDPAKSLRIILVWQIGVTMFAGGAGSLACRCARCDFCAAGRRGGHGGRFGIYVAGPVKKSANADSRYGVDGLSRILKAEGAKVGVIVILLWLVLAVYKEVVILGFIGTFIVAIIIFSMAIFLRNPALLEMPEAGKNNVN